VTVIVLHSTEGSTLEGAIATLMANNACSHEVWDVKDREMVNLVPLDVPARSLLNRPGGVETNRRGGVVQVELVGYASRYSAGDREPVVPEFNDGDLLWLGSQLRELCTRVGAPFVFPCEFKPYPESYGRNGVRLSFTAWQTIEGVIGHMHVPENSHGDPGALDVARMATLSAPAPIEPIRPPFPPPILEELLVSTSAFQLIGNAGLVRVFVPGQRSVELGGLGDVHVTLNKPGFAPVAGVIPQDQLETFAARWDASVA
jgi:hypothetical protein